MFDVGGQIYNRAGIGFRALTHLDSLGLIKFDDISRFARLNLAKKITVSYYGGAISLTFPHENGNALPIGKVFLTRASEQLAPICGAIPVEGFYEFVYDRWASESLVPKREA